MIEAQTIDWGNEFRMSLRLTGAPVCADHQDRSFRPTDVSVRWTVEHTDGHEAIRPSEFRFLTVTVIGALVEDPGERLPLGHRTGSRRYRQIRDADGGYREWDEIPAWLAPAMEIAERRYHQFCAEIAAA